MHPLDEARLKLFVLPTDLDIAGHINNGRYLSLLDLVRFDLMDRVGLVTVARRLKAWPVLGAITVRYRRELRLWQPFTITARILCWDEKSVYFEHRFIDRDGVVACHALARGLLRDRKGALPVSSLLAELGHALDSPDWPDAVRQWAAAEAAQRAITTPPDADT